MRKIFMVLAMLLAIQPALQGQSWHWARNEAGGQSDLGKGIAADMQNNLFTVGEYNQQDMVVQTVGGPVTLTNNGSVDISLIKYDVTGNALWAFGFGSTKYDIATRVETDDFGNAYITGRFNSPSINFGNGVTVTHSGGNFMDAFFVKFDANGVAQWGYSMGGSRDELGVDVAVTQCGVVFTGTFQSQPANLIDGTGSTVASLTNANTNGFNQDIFLIEFDLNGVLQWAHSWGAPMSDDVGLALTHNGPDLYLLSGYKKPFNFPGLPALPLAGGSRDPVITRLDCATGLAFQWQRTAGGSQIDNIADISFGNNRIFAHGDFQSPTFTIQGGPSISNTGSGAKTDLVTYCLNANTGAPLWIRQGAGSSWDFASAVHTDNCGNAYVVGRFGSPSVNFGGTVLNSTSLYSNFYMVKYNSAGTLIWAEHVQGTSGGSWAGAIPRDVTVNNMNDPAVTGSMAQSVSFGGIFNLTSSNAPSTIYDHFTAKLRGNSNVITSLNVSPSTTVCLNDPPVQLDGNPNGGIGIWTSSAPTALGSAFSFGPHLNSFDPSVAGVGTHLVCFSRLTFFGGQCASTSCVYITVNPAPQVSFATPPAVCAGDPPIDLSSYVSPAGGVFSGTGVSGNFFDPSQGILGSNPVDYTYTDPSTGCSATATVNITVNAGLWHVGSNPTAGLDQAYDVAADAFGGVYITGRFGGTTTFYDQYGNNINLSTAQLGMFVVKYDACGELMWANHSLDYEVDGRGVTVDEGTEMVYVTGQFKGEPLFMDWCGTNNVQINGSGSYVAQYDMNTGCQFFVEQIPSADWLKTEAITDWDGNVYVTGAERNPGTSTDFFISTRKFTPDASFGVANNLNPAVWTTNSDLYATPNHTGRDIVVDASTPSAERVLVIGDFTKALLYSGSSLTVISPGLVEAIFVDHKEISGNVAGVEIAGISSGGRATGQGISVSPQGDVFLTGSYRDGNLSNTFSTGVNLTGGALARAFVVGFGPNVGAWGTDVNALPNGDVSGMGIAYSGNELVVVGNFRNDDIVSPFVPFVSVNGPTKSYSVGLDLLGNPLWGNATASPNTAWTHFAYDVATTPSGSYFMTGWYRGAVDYVNDASFSGPLPFNFLNAVFLIHGEDGGGQYLREGQPSSQPAATRAEVTPAWSLTAFPNPVEQMVTLRSEGGTAFSWQITDTHGRILLSGEGDQGDQSIDMGGLAAGVYFLQVQGESEERSIRLFKN